MPCYLRGSLKINNIQRFIELARQNHWTVIQEGEKLTISRNNRQYTTSMEELRVGNIVKELNSITRQYTIDTVKSAVRQKGSQISSIKEDNDTVRIRVRS